MNAYEQEEAAGERRTTKVIFKGVLKVPGLSFNKCSKGLDKFNCHLHFRLVKSMID